MRLDVIGDTLCAQVTASALAQVGNEVCWWIPPGQTWERLESNQAAFAEQPLQQCFLNQCADGRLKIASYEQLPETLSGRVVFLALQPCEPEQAENLISWLLSCEPDLLVNQTVFPVGTTEELQARFSASQCRTRVVAMPDLLQEGQALQGFTRSDQMLIGCEDDWSETQMREILRPFNRRKDVIQRVLPREAEFSRLAISAMLATRISFMNDMAASSKTLGIDIDKVRLAMGADSRIGDSYLYPGCGFGGPGFSRDVMNLARVLSDTNVDAGLLERVLQINESQKELLFRLFWQHFEGEVSGKKVAIWGLSFKPQSDRIDNAPALSLAEALWAQDVEIQAHDPAAMGAMSEWAKDRGVIRFYEDPYSALEGADALMLVTEWKIYWSPDWDKIRSSLRTPLILDGRNVYDPKFMVSQGFTYHGVGRG